MARIGESIKCVLRVRPVGEDERAGEPSCIELRGDEIVVLPSAAVSERESSPARLSTPLRHASSASALFGEPPRTPTSARGRAPSTPQPRTPVGRTPSGTAHAPAADGSVARTYGFDRVLPPTASQEDVWQLCVPFVEAPLEGFNACIFAYGQTGSGKTHTMLGTPEDPGVIRRACERLFGAMRARGETKFQLSLTYVELYNNEFKDLLAPEHQPGRKRALPIELEAVRKRRPIAIHEFPTAPGMPPSVFLSGSETLNTPVRSAEELLELVAFGAAARTVGATKLNASSSRSHAVLTVQVEARDPDASRARVGKLHLVDLAGSENLTLSGADGGTRVEAQAINSSLSALCDVLAALSKRGFEPAGSLTPVRGSGGASCATPRGGRPVTGVTAIPYRNHKLTRLLADSIGGNSKTLMLTTILPFTSCHRQTYMAIHFAARARAIRAHVALSLQVPDDGLGSAAAAALKEEVDRARAEVETLCVKLTQRDDEIRLLEQTNAARETAHFSEAGRSLRQLEDAKRREEAALQAQLGELRQQRSNERIEAEQATKRLWLELSLRDAEANTRALELCSQLEQMEALQDTLESQFATLQRSGRDVSELRAQRDAVLQAVDEDTRALGAALEGWEANTRALADSSARVDELDAQARRVAEELVGASAHVSSLQAEVERQAAELEAARTAGEGAATTASKASAKARESADKAVDKAAKTAADAAEKATNLESTLRGELASTRAQLQSAEEALVAVKKRASDEQTKSTKADKQQLAQLNADLVKARADTKTARSAVDEAQRDAADARDARDARLTAEGTLRRRVALLEARLRQSQSGFAELNACVADARALPALQTRLRGIVAITRLLTAPLPAFEGNILSAAVYPPIEPSQIAQPPMPAPVERSAQAIPSTPADACHSQGAEESPGMSALLGIPHDEQNARVAKTLQALRLPLEAPVAAACQPKPKGGRRKSAVKVAAPEPEAKEPEPDEEVAAAAEEEEVLEEAVQPRGKGGRGKSAAKAAVVEAEAMEMEMEEAAVKPKGKGRGGRGKPAAEAAVVEAEEDLRVRSNKRSDRTSGTPRDAADDDEGADHAQAEQPDDGGGPSPAITEHPSKRPSRRGAKRTYTPEALVDDDEEGGHAAPKKRKAAAAKPRGLAPRDELVSGPSLVNVGKGGNKRQAAAQPAHKGEEQESAARVVPEKENGAREEVMESSKRRALFNPRRRASHAFAAMI